MKKFKARAWPSVSFFKSLPVGLAGILFCICLRAQENQKCLPFITNYHYQDYNADGINWWSVEDDNGVMYFANGKGLLVYDGQHWELIRLPDLIGVRSLVKGRDGK